MKWHQDGDKDHSAETASRISEIMKKLDEDGVLDRIAREPFVMANRRLVLAVHHNLDYLAFVNSLPKSQKELELKFSQFAGISLFSSKGTPQAVFAAAGAVIRRLKRILVVDFDVHHGNGTQEIFYDNKHVLFFSSHCGDLTYPKSNSKASHIGEGAGEGYNINFPLAEGFNEDDLLYAVNKILLPVATKFDPEVVLVSAGFDAGIDDMGGCNVSSKGFGTVVRKLLCLAGGKMVLALEGGYNLKHLPTHVSHSIRAILGDEDAFFPDYDQTDHRPSESTISMADNLQLKLSPYWDVFVEKPPGPTPEGETPPRPGAVGGDPSGALGSHSSS
ncbi:histone deacetylase 6 isoform X2 [Triticum aestivum]|uniref:histone deacetylase 6 isoform X2 n=1 Tax=Triticum aestivum TaxID=4565 RepID=UPI001D01B8B2|nr:histone deacetylase 6-like isoform X2 [Triticum aestivum]